jgi:hypothetical protein
LDTREARWRARPLLDGDRRGIGLKARLIDNFEAAYRPKTVIYGKHLR